MALTVGGHADITLLNAITKELSEDGVWALVELPADALGNIPSYWIPQDARTKIVPSVPPNWPPRDGDVWTTGTIDAWVVDDGGGHLYFVTENNVRNHTTPIRVDVALAQFGTSLQMLYRKA
jgi:hypothetical protein